MLIPRSGIIFGMDAFLISTAILLSVFLLFKYAVPIGKPKIVLGERLSRAAIENRFALLGKRCAVTRRGFGVYYRHFDVRAVVKKLDGISDGDWADEIKANAALLVSTYEAALETVRLSYTLGHVDGLPRVYVFCAELVSCCCGGVTEEAAQIALAAFEKYSPLTVAERNALRGMTEFCACGLICEVAAQSLAANKVYKRGVRDGAEGKIDLDGIRDPEYFCGLISGASDDERRSAMSIAESNNIECDSLIGKHVKRLAEGYASVRAAVRTVKNMPRSLCFSVGIPHAVSPRFSDKRITRLFDLAPVVLTAVFAVLACVFVPPRFAAVVPVAAILLYGGFRLPMLLYAPQRRGIEFSSAWRRFRGKFSRRQDKPRAVVGATDSEIAYFGDEPQYSRQVIKGGFPLVSDNRGRLATRGGDLEISFTSGGRRYELCEFGGVRVRGRTVYRLFTNDLELSAELTVPLDSDCCIARIAAVNRTARRKSVVVRAQIVGKAKRCAVNIGGNVFLGGRGSGMLDIPPFSVERTDVAAAHGNSDAEVRRIFDGVMTDGGFEYAADCARVASDGELSGVSPHGMLWRDGDTDTPKPMPTGRAENVVFGGDYAVSLGDGGVVGFTDLRSGIDVIPSGDERVYVLIGDGGKLVSPFGGRTEHRIGRTVYYAGGNGLICATACRGGEHGVLFDVFIKNSLGHARKLDIMFAATAHDGANITCDGQGAAVRGKSDYFVACSSEVNEYALFKEGWFARGKPIRASGFRAGGSTPSTVLRTECEISSHGYGKVTFCISESKIDVSEEIRGAARRNIEYAARFSGITLRTTDEALNAATAVALYKAYTFGAVESTVTPSVVRCIKYVDKAEAGRRILRLLGESESVSGAGGLYAAHAVSDYVLYTGDFGFLSEKIYYRNGRSRTVLEHCRRVLDGVNLYARFEDGASAADYFRTVQKTCEFFADRCVGSRRDAYMKIAAVATEKITSKIPRSANRLVACRELYEYGKFDGGYELLHRAAEEISSGRETTADDCARFYLLVVEKLLGLRQGGNRVRVLPRIADNCPHIEFDMAVEGGAARITIDDTQKTGEWRMKVGAVSYALDSFGVRANCGKDIVFYRTGKSDV